MERKAVFYVLMIAVFSLFTACFSGWQEEEGSFSINIGGGGQAAVNGARSNWDPDGLGWLENPNVVHTIRVHSGPGPEKSVDIIGKSSAVFTVTPGRWTISAEAYDDDGILRAMGEVTRDIKPGRNGTIEIDMYPAEGGSYKLPLTITVINGPSRTLIPFDSADSFYGTTATVSFTVEGLEDDEDVMVTIAANDYGLSTTPVSSSAGTLTLIYDGMTLVDDTSVSVNFAIYGISSYTLDGISQSIEISIIDGQDENRAIPVTAANIAAFNTYAADAAANILTRHYELRENVNLTNAWIPIGNYSGYGEPFTGTFNGKSNTITGLTITAAGYYESCGMFGEIDFGSEVRDLGLINCSITDPENFGTSFIGGIAGNNRGTVEKCYVTGGTIITNASSYVGGVVGCNRGTLKECYSSSIINGSSNVGGVAGSNEGPLENCYSTGTVTGSYDLSDCNVGGVAGKNIGPLKNCYSTSDVTGIGQNVGGVVGSNGLTVQYCYATGSVSGDNNFVGGVAGRNGTGNTVEYCVALNSKVKGVANDYTGRIVGLNGTPATANGILNNNYARSDLVPKIGTTGATKPIATPPNVIDGESVQIDTVYSIVFSGWGSDIWKDVNSPLTLTIGNNLPTLVNVQVPGSIMPPTLPVTQ